METTNSTDNALATNINGLGANQEDIQAAVEAAAPPAPTRTFSEVATSVRNIEEAYATISAAIEAKGKEAETFISEIRAQLDADVAPLLTKQEALREAMHAEVQQLMDRLNPPKKRVSGSASGPTIEKVSDSQVLEAMKELGTPCTSRDVAKVLKLPATAIPRMDSLRARGLVDYVDGLARNCRYVLKGAK